MLSRKYTHLLHSSQDILPFVEKWHKQFLKMHNGNGKPTQNPNACLAGLGLRYLWCYLVITVHALDWSRASPKEQEAKSGSFGVTEICSLQPLLPDASAPLSFSNSVNFQHCWQCYKTHTDNNYTPSLVGAHLCNDNANCSMHCTCTDNRNKMSSHIDSAHK